MNNKEMLVSAIENGTVIDHIPAEMTFDVVNLLHLQEAVTPVTIGMNLPSKKLAAKGIIKVADKFLTDEEISRLSVIAPNIVVNEIRNFEVIKKRRVETPEELHGIVKCNNPVCITNNEPMPTLFHVVDKNNGIIRCHYCEKEQNIKNVKLV